MKNTPSYQNEQLTDFQKVLAKLKKTTPSNSYAEWKAKQGLPADPPKQDVKDEFETAMDATKWQSISSPGAADRALERAVQKELYGKKVDHTPRNLEQAIKEMRDEIEEIRENQGTPEAMFLKGCSEVEADLLDLSIYLDELETTIKSITPRVQAEKY